MGYVALILAFAVSGACKPVAKASGGIAWETRFDQSVFERAAREHRYVLLDLHAVWCHWCHVMDQETYADPEVRAFIEKRYLAVSIDADADPSLAARYADWGWPATIVFAPDATEIVKRRGYLAPRQMASLLQAIIDDPTPGPSVQPITELAQTSATGLSTEQRTALKRNYDSLYDVQHGGWGTIHKYADAAALEYALELWTYEGDTTAAERVRQTLDANLKLIDPVWGGVYQYSDRVDWSSPHYEKLLAFQADDLRLYTEAYAQWHDWRYLHAAEQLRRYMVDFLMGPDGAFYVSQDADMSASVTGHQYYSLDADARRHIGIPRIDRNKYVRENGWAIRALCKFYDVTQDESALAAAKRAAQWALAERASSGGGFKHDASNRGGPFLDDTVAMAQGFLALYRSSGDQRWLTEGRAALAYVETHFGDSRAGFFSTPVPASASGVFREPARSVEQNAAVVESANLLYRYTGDAQYRHLAEHGMKFLVAAAASESERLHADILLADREQSGAPIHITIVGAKDDPLAAALHASALRFPAEYLQIDWWDRRDGPLPNREIQYPVLARAAAFACTATTCSTPVFDPKQLIAAVRSANM
jgi:uncharacterized protein YyaL (SSP411 family)